MNHLGLADDERAFLQPRHAGSLVQRAAHDEHPEQAAEDLIVGVRPGCGRIFVFGGLDVGGIRQTDGIIGIRAAASQTDRFTGSSRKPAALWSIRS